MRKAVADAMEKRHMQRHERRYSDGQKRVSLSCLSLSCVSLASVRECAPRVRVSMGVSPGCVRRRHRALPWCRKVCKRLMASDGV